MSVTSSPAIPLCPGTQIRRMRCSIPNKFNCSIHSRSNEDLISQDDKALSNAWLSLRMAIHSFHSIISKLIYGIHLRLEDVWKTFHRHRTLCSGAIYFSARAFEPSVYLSNASNSRSPCQGFHYIGSSFPIPSNKYGLELRFERWWNIFELTSNGFSFLFPFNIILIVLLLLLA